MIPIYLNPTLVRTAVVGRGPLAARRVTWLRTAGATPDVWSDELDRDAAAMAPQIFDRMPNATELARYGAIWIAGLDAQKSQSLAEAGRDAGALVNVEDVVELCDFHTPAVVRRGRLTLAAGTGGASPAVARAARERLEQAFTADWAAALDDIADARTRLRKNGAGFDALVADARARLTQHGLS